MSYSEAMALIRQAERQMAGAGQPAALALPGLGLLPKLPPQLPAPRRLPA